MDKLEEMKKKFHILDDWTITMGSDQGLNGTPYTGQCNINLDKHIAIIYPWHTDELEPSDYILHEILHIAIQAVLVDYEYRELFVQDLCIQFKEMGQLREALKKNIEKVIAIREVVEKMTTGNMSHHVAWIKDIAKDLVILSRQALKRGGG